MAKETNGPPPDQNPDNTNAHHISGVYILQTTKVVGGMAAGEKYENWGCGEKN